MRVAPNAAQLKMREKFGMHTNELKPAKVLASYRKSRFENESADYEDARDALLAEEIEVRRHLTRLAEQRRSLPLGPLIEKGYAL
jgi:hypothetical protein